MGLTEAARRILVTHWLLILLCGLAGGTGMYVLSGSGPAEYTASTRLLLGSPDPAVTEDVTAIADSAQAIVTSPGLVRDVLDEAGGDRDAIEFAERAVAVRALGGSGVLELSATDTSPVLAADVANALTDRLMASWVETSGGQVSEVIAALQAQIITTNADITTLERKSTELDLQILDAVDPREIERLEAERTAISVQLEGLVQNRLLLQSEMGGLFIDAASGTEPQIIDPAVPPAQADPRNTISSVALGVFLGLLIGVAIAALIESFHPTLVGVYAIADELKAPVLGTLPSRRLIQPLRPTPVGAALAKRVQLAAAGAKATNLELVSVGPKIDLSNFDEAFGFSHDRGMEEVHANGGRGPSVHVFGAPGPDDGESNGQGATALVVVTPSVLKRSQLRSLQDLQSFTTWPLLGVIAYHRSAFGHSPNLDQPPVPGA